MRTESTMFELFNRMALDDDRIRAMTLEGSRVNPSVKPDVWQDYDIAFLVTDKDSFMKSDDWLYEFGELVFLQKPEAMHLFPPDFPDGWFSYLMLFSDGVKIDLTLVPVDDAETYFRSDPLIKVLIDKDGICPKNLVPNDDCFHITKPPREFIEDCANEFLFVSTYITKGLLRNELIFANKLFDSILRTELIRMLGYLAGGRCGFPINTGKNNKWLEKYLKNDEYAALTGTYGLCSISDVWTALYLAIDLFESSACEVCTLLGYEYDSRTGTIKNYIDVLKSLKTEEGFCEE